jgi:hypothetical protein
LSKNFLRHHYFRSRQYGIVVNAEQPMNKMRATSLLPTDGIGSGTPALRSVIKHFLQRLDLFSTPQPHFGVRPLSSAY